MVARRPSGRRPERFLGLAFAGATLLAMWGAVAHASGSQWVQAVGALVAGIFVAGVLGPRFALGRVEVRVEKAPADAIAGTPTAVTVVANRPCRLVPVRPGGAAVALSSGEPSIVELLPPHRGELAAIAVRIGSAAPLGLLWWAGSCRLELPRSIAVAPAFAVAGGRPREGDTDDASPGQDGAPRRAAGDQPELRGVREYRVGDSQRRVHWRASAHAGTLMVRETEDAAEAPVLVVADLPEDPERAEAAASEVMTTVRRLLDLRRHVLLETVEHARRQVSAVRDIKEAGRRLARAGTNPWGELGPHEHAS